MNDNKFPRAQFQRGYVNGVDEDGIEFSRSETDEEFRVRLKALLEGLHNCFRPRFDGDVCLACDAEPKP